MAETLQLAEEIALTPDMNDWDTYSSRLSAYVSYVRRPRDVLYLTPVTSQWKSAGINSDGAVFSTVVGDKTFYAWVFSKYYSSAYKVLVKRLMSGETTTVEVFSYNDREWIAIPSKDV